MNQIKFTTNSIYVFLTQKIQRQRSNEDNEELLQGGRSRRFKVASTYIKKKTRYTSLNFSWYCMEC